MPHTGLSSSRALRPVLLISFATALLSLGGCGYSLQMAGDSQAPEDPVTILRREVRQLKADHRVALFDLEKSQEKKLKLMEADLKLALQSFRTRMGRNSVASDEQFSEIENQHRLIHGRIDESENRSKERSEGSNRFALGELQRLSKTLKTQNEISQKEQTRRNNLEESLSAQVDDLHKKEGQVAQTFQKNLGSLEEQTRNFQGSASRKMNALSQQVSELIEKALPALNRIAARMDDLEWKFDKLSASSNTDGLTKRLGDLSESIDVQRQSLEMLGNTLISKVDKQNNLLKKSGQRLDKLEAK